MARSAALLCLAALVALAAALVATVDALPRPGPAVTPEQYEKSLKMLRNICQPKVGLPDDLLQKMRDGDFPDDNRAHCYTACFLQTMMVLKNNKVDAKMFKNQVKKLMMPDDANRIIAAFGACEGTPPGAEPCETTALFVKCVTKVDPTFKVPA